MNEAGTYGRCVHSTHTVDTDGVRTVSLFEVSAWGSTRQLIQKEKVTRSDECADSGETVGRKVFPPRGKPSLQSHVWFCWSGQQIVL